MSPHPVCSNSSSQYQRVQVQDVLWIWWFHVETARTVHKVAVFLRKSRQLQGGMEEHMRLKSAEWFQCVAAVLLIKNQVHIQDTHRRNWKQKVLKEATDSISWLRISFGRTWQCKSKWALFKHGGGETWCGPATSTAHNQTRLLCFESLGVIQLNFAEKPGVCFCQALQEHANPWRCFGKDLPARCHRLTPYPLDSNHQESWFIYLMFEVPCVKCRRASFFSVRILWIF